MTAPSRWLSESTSDTTGSHTQQNRTPQGVPASNRWLSNATPPDCRPQSLTNPRPISVQSVNHRHSAAETGSLHPAASTAKSPQHYRIQRITKQRHQQADIAPAGTVDPIPTGPLRKRSAPNPAGKPPTSHLDKHPLRSALLQNNCGLAKRSQKRQIRKRITMSTLSRELFIKRVAEAASHEHLVVFIGAGVSKASGLPLWSELIQPIAEEFYDGQTVPKNVDLADVADAFAASACGGQRRLRETVVRALNKVNAKPNKIHLSLAGLKLRAVFTTNYDDLLMDSLKDHRARRVVDHAVAQHTDYRDDLPIFHLHGHIDSPNSLVLTRSEYERYSDDNPGFMKTLEAYLTKFTVLYLGYSGGDEHFRQLSSLVKQRFPKLAPGNFSAVLSIDPMTEHHWTHFNADVFSLEVKPEDAENALAALLQDVAQAITPSDILKINRSEYQLLTSFVSEQIERDLREIPTLAREDLLEEAETRLRQLKAPHTWPQLTPAQKANVYRNLIHVVLRRRGNADEATSLIQEAETECADHRFVANHAELSRELGRGRQFLDSYPEPQSSQEWRWKLVLMLECGKYAEVLAEITSPPTQIPPDVNTQTLAALAHLGMRDIEAATASNASVLSTNPRWTSNLELRAIIHYWRCIAPDWTEWLHTSTPLPVPSCAILLGPEISEQLQQTADTFARLSALADKGNKAWCTRKAWQLAALILRWKAEGGCPDDPFLASANEVLDELLAVTSSIPHALAWAASAGLDYATEGVINILRTEAEAGHLDHADALCRTLILQGGFAEASAVLDTFQPLYAKADRLRGWRFHRVQIAHELHDSQTVANILSEAADQTERLHLEYVVAWLNATRAKDLKQCLPAVRDLADATGNITDLFDAANLHLLANEPQFVLDHADALLTRLPSLATFDLIVSSARNAEQWRRCLDLVEANMARLPQGNAQIAALGLKVECLTRLNLPHEAAILAKEIALQSNNPDHLMPWFDLARDAGDVDTMVTIATMLRSHEQIAPAKRLHVAENIQATHPQLATALLDDLLRDQAKLNPHESVAAWHLASRLGREGGLHDLLARGLSPGGPLIAIPTLEVLIQMLRESHKASEEREKLYTNGHAPIHIHFAAERQLLSRAIERALPEREPKYGYAPLRMRSLRVRHGSRQAILNLPNAKLRFFLDVTSLLMLHHLGVLPKVVEHSFTIYLSPSIRAFLVRDIKGLGDRQLSIIEKRQRLLNEVDAGRLKVIPMAAAGYASAQRPQAGADHARLFAGDTHVLVDFWPSIDRAGIESRAATHQTGPSGLLRAMAEAGWLAEADVTKATTTLESFGVPSPSITLEPGSRVVLAPSMVDSLIDAGCLDELLSRCDVWISQSELTDVRDILHQDQNDRSLIEQLKHLNQWLADNVERVKFVYKGQQRNLGIDHPLSLCLSDVVDENREASVWTICDDRWLTIWKKTGMSTVAGTLEVLQWLRIRDAISEGDHHHCLLRLRLGNCRYIPLTVQELMYHLQRGINQRTGEFLETPELSILRKYTASILLDQEFLQMTDDPELFETSEFMLALSVYQTVAKVIGRVWSSQARIETKQAQAEWLVAAFTCDALSLRASFFPAVIEAEHPGKWECHFFVGACMEVIESVRGSRLLATLKEMTPWLVERLARHSTRRTIFMQEIGSLAELISTRTEEVLPSHQVLPWFRAMAASLPRGYDSTATLSPISKDALGIRSITTIGTTEFWVDALWPAIADVIGGKPRTTLDSCNDPPVSHELHCRDGKSDAPTIQFRASNGYAFVLYDRHLALAHPEMEKRLDFLSSMSLALEVRPEDAEATFTAIAAVPSPEDRVQKYLDARTSSVSAQFDDLEETFSKSKTIPIDCLMAAVRPSSVDSLLRHARLPSALGQAPVDGVFEDAARVLISERGLRIAFYTFASLPRRLPECVVEEFCKLSRDEQDRFVEEVEGARGSVLHRLHVSAILIRGGDKAQAKALEILTHLSSSESSPQWRFHGALLRWVYHEVTSDSTASEGKAEVLAACWLFAGVFHSRVGLPADVDSVTSALQKLALNVRQLFAIDHHVAHDVASPLNFSGRLALVFGLPNLIEIDLLEDGIQNSLRLLARGLSFAPSEPASPQGTILHLKSLSANRLGSFLVPFSEDRLPLWFSSEEGEWLRPDAGIRLVHDWCSESFSESRPGEAITGVCALTTEIVVPAPVRDAVGMLLDRFTFTNLEHWEPERLHVLARFLFLQSVWHRSDDEEFWLSRFVEFIHSLLRPESADSFSLIDSLLDVSHHMSLAKDDQSARAARFSDLIRVIVKEKPELASRLWMPISRMIVSLEGRVQAQLWRILTELRASA